MSTQARTGNQYCIHAGELSAVICQLGAKIRRFDHSGKPVLCPFGQDDLTPTCNGYILAPWPNRMENGEYDFGGSHYRVPVNEQTPKPRNNANHGFAYQYFWGLECLTETSVTQSLRFPNLDGYPFDVSLKATYAIDERGLSATVTATNNDSRTAPWALGFHPWLANGGNGETAAERDADSQRCRLRIDADTHVTVNDSLIPVGTEPVTGVYDLRDSPTLEGRTFDDAWVDVARGKDGTTAAVFTRPDGVEVSIIADRTVNAWQCYTATGAPIDEHPAGIAVEPMTAPANAFRTGAHLVSIPAGDSYSTTVRYQVAQR
ncbi:MAG: aldose 1-epimerase family protein [Bifidobacterium sp.]|jgi:aldose 1-epimerase